MAAVTDTNNLTYYLNGEPIAGVYISPTGGVTNFINGEPMTTIFSTTVNFGQFFLMF